MRRWFTLLLILLLPAQALAAVTHVACTLHASASGDAGMSQMDMNAACHAAHDSAHAGDELAGHDHEADAGTLHDDCRLCGVCLVSALPPGAQAFTGVQPATAFETPLATPVSRPPGRIDRPPRFLLA